MSETLSTADEFVAALETNAPRYGVRLEPRVTGRLRDYYQLVRAWNPRLHLVAPCPPEEFATRHVLESMFAIAHIPEGARIADIGSGAGLPIIPCLIARPDVHAVLIEASLKKSVFCREALRVTGLRDNASILNARFEQTETPEIEVITCRALERLTGKIQDIVRWSQGNCRLLLFGGPAMRTELEALRRAHTAVHLPRSERRFLFIVDKEQG